MQAWSNSAVTLEFFSPTNTLLATVAMPFSHVMGSYNIYNYTINWAAIGGLIDGSYLKVSNASSEVWYSEAIENAKSPVIKIQYSCNRDSAVYGSFRKCFEQIMYAPAVLADYDRIEKQTTYLDSRIVNHVISHTSIPVAKLYTDSMPYYMHEILRDALCHDVIVIDNLAWQKTDEGYKTNHNLQSSIHSAECLLREASTAILRLASQRNLNAGAAPILQPETNILAAGFTINWLDADGDSYDVQLATDATFATIVFSINITGLTYTFTGLNQDTLYYYRVRSLSCAGTSPWSSDNVRTLETPMASGIKVEFIPSLGTIYPSTGYSGLALDVVEMSLCVIFRGYLLFESMYLLHLAFLQVHTSSNSIATFQSDPAIQVPNVNYYNFVPSPTTVYAFAITRNNGVEKVYINGVLLGTNTCYSWGVNTGMAFNANGITSEIYDIKGYNRELSQSEISSISTSQGAISPTGAFIDIPFTEISGDYAYDISGNNNNLTLIMNFPSNRPELQQGTSNHHIDSNGNPIL